MLIVGHLLIPPIKESLCLVPCGWGHVSFEIVYDEIVEFFVVEIIVYATPVRSRLKCEMELSLMSTVEMLQVELGWTYLGGGVRN